MSAGSDDNYKKFTAENTEVLGMSANAAFSQKAFVDFIKVKYPLLSDRDGKTMKAFGVWDEERRLAKRSYILVDKEGVIRFINTRPTNTEKDLLSTETLLDEVKKVNKK
jgi:mycoredoxin-dependent peroxiredoxin